MFEVGDSHHAPLYGKWMLVDGDILAYRCAFAAEKTRYLVQDVGVFEAHKDIPKDTPKEVVWSQKEIQPVEFALQALKTTMEWLKETTRCSDLDIYLSGRRNFRYDVAVTKPYKGNRETVGKPTHYRACIDYLKDNYGAITTDGYEADDALGIRSNELGEDCFICTIDKDLDQLPGWKFSWVNDLVYRVSAREASFNLYRQILAGDHTDNVPGLDGVGLGRASKLLEGCQSTADLFERSWGAYRDRIQPVDRAWEYFLEQARLVTIMTKEGQSLEDRIPQLRGAKPSNVDGSARDQVGV